MSGATNMCIFIKAYVGTGGVLKCISELDALQKNIYIQSINIEPNRIVKAVPYHASRMIVK